MELTDEFWLNLNKILIQSLVPSLSNEIVRPCAKKDFEDFRNTITDKLQQITLFLDLIIHNKAYCTKKNSEFLFKVIVIIGEQHKKSAWNTNRTVELSKLLNIKICIIFQSKNVSEILKDDELFIIIIKFLRPKLLRNTWKCFPAAVDCYKWLLESIEKPLLKKHVSEIVPTALIILDDYINKYQILGLKCISTIIEHCQKSRILKKFNYDEVIFQALKRMCYKAEPFLMSLYFCISSLLTNIDYYENKNNTFKWNKRDEILAILFDNMESQIHFQYRNDYIICISKFITCINLGKWSDRITRILNGYCENDINLHTIGTILNFTKIFLNIYQPQGSNFFIIIYNMLLKLRYNCNLIEKQAKEIIDNIDQCIIFLNKQCPYIYKDIILSNKIQSIEYIN